MSRYIVERRHNPHFADHSGKFVADADGKIFTDSLEEAMTFTEIEASDLAEKFGDFKATARRDDRR